MPSTSTDLQRASSVPAISPLNLAAQANSAHLAARAAVKNALECAREAGEALIAAKRQLPHGAWAGWLVEHVQFGERTAQGYMRLAREWLTLDLKAQRVADLPLRDALAALSSPAQPTVPSEAYQALRSQHDALRQDYEQKLSEYESCVAISNGDGDKEMALLKQLIAQAERARDDHMMQTCQKAGQVVRLERELKRLRQRTSAQ